MRIVSRFKTQHYELFVEDDQGNPIWAHLISIDTVDPAIVDKMMVGFECVGLQYGFNHNVCAQPTAHLAQLQTDIAIEETYDGVWIVDPRDYVDYNTMFPIL